jgi:hypothetical protein
VQALWLKDPAAYMQDANGKYASLLKAVKTLPHHVAVSQPVLSNGRPTHWLKKNGHWLLTLYLAFVNTDGNNDGG